MDSLTIENNNESLEVQDNIEVKIATDAETATSDIVEVEAANSDNVGPDAASTETTEIILPPNVTLEPRNDEEMHLGLLNGNQHAMQIYLPVSDDNGEMFGVEKLVERIRSINKCCTNPGVSQTKDRAKLVEKLKEICIEFHYQINMVESRCIGGTTKLRIIEGTSLNIIKEYIRATEGPVWKKWFNENFDKREFRSAQDYMLLAKILGIIRYAVFGKERLLKIVRCLKKSEKKSDDPVGDFIRKYNIVFSPEKDLNVQELKIEIDIAISHHRCVKEGLTISRDAIESHVRNGKEIAPKDIEDFKFLITQNQDITTRFKEIVASKGKAPPLDTPERKVRRFTKAKSQFINLIDFAIDDPAYLVDLTEEDITQLKNKLHELEQKYQANKAKTNDVSVDTAKLTIN